MSFEPGEVLPTSCPGCKEMSLSISARINTDAFTEIVNRVENAYGLDNLTQIGTQLVVYDDLQTDALNIMDWEGLQEKYPIRVYSRDSHKHIFVEGDDQLMICSECGWINDVSGDNLVDAVFYKEKAKHDIPTEFVPMEEELMETDTKSQIDQSAFDKAVIRKVEKKID